MKIALLRHAKVLFEEPVISTASSFYQARADYDDSPLEAPPIHLFPEEFPRCYVSTMQRAQQTAELVYQGPAIRWDELVEVEYTLLFFRWIPVPTRIRKFISRIQWLLNWKNVKEKKRDTMARARKVIRQLMQEKSSDTLLITHGFFMRCLQHELHKLGFKGSIGLSPNHAHPYIFEYDGSSST